MQNTAETSALLRLQNNYLYSNSNKVTLIFYDKEKNESIAKEYNLDILIEIPFFKICFGSNFKETNQFKIDFSAFVEEEFVLILDLWQNRHLLEVVNEDLLCNPDFYERLDDQIAYLFVEQKEEIDANIREHLRSMNYKTAAALLCNYEDIIRQQPEIKTKEEQPTKPFYISIAEDIVTKALFFKDIPSYEKNHLLKLRKIQKKIDATKKVQRLLNKELSKWEITPQFSLKPLIESIETQNQKIKTLANDLLKIHDGLNVKNLSPSRLLHLSKQSDSKNEKIQPLMSIIKRHLKLYYAKALNTLQYQQGQNLADMKRKDLLKHIELFAHYDFEPHEDSAWGKCFHLAGFANFYFAYGLKNEYPKDLEQEMRSDISGALSQSGYSSYILPEILISENATSFMSVDNVEMQGNCMEEDEVEKISPEIKQLRTLLLLFMKKGKTMTERAEMKAPLIEYWKWDRFGIKVEDFGLLPLPMGTKKDNVVRVTGTIKKFDREIPFYFVLDDFKPVILDDELDPTPEATDAYLTKLVAESKLQSSNGIAVDLQMQPEPFYADAVEGPLLIRREPFYRINM